MLDRYSSAITSSNLRSTKENTVGDLDILGAAGLTARRNALGISLARLFAGGKVEPVIEILAETAFKRSRTLKMQFSYVQAVDLSKAVLSWYRYGTCQPCGGTGYRKIADTPVLGDECRHCKATGKLSFDKSFQAEIRPLAQWLSMEMERVQASAGSEARQKLG